jgi:hypothetical protein
MDRPERRFNDVEIATIFERAAAHQERGKQLVPTGEGLTLGQLQEIGREIGITPAVIADAARLLDDTRHTVTRRFLGLPLRVERIVPLPHRLSDEEWERVVVDLREIFDARGVLRKDGSLRQWTNGNLQALLEVTESAQRIRLRTFKGNAPSLMAAGLGILGAASAGLAALALGGSGDVGALAALTFAATAGAGMLGVTALRLIPWARRRREQMAEVAARVMALEGPRPESGDRAAD